MVICISLQIYNINSVFNETVCNENKKNMMMKNIKWFMII